MTGYQEGTEAGAQSKRKSSVLDIWCQPPIWIYFAADTPGMTEDQVYRVVPISKPVLETEDQGEVSP